MKIKDIISELQRFDGNENCVILLPDGDTNELFDVKPHNGSRYSAAIECDGDGYTELKEEVEDRDKLLNKARDLVESLSEAFEEANYTKSAKLISELKDAVE